jgi:hypothetical protein
MAYSISTTQLIRIVLTYLLHSTQFNINSLTIFVASALYLLIYD